MSNGYSWKEWKAQRPTGNAGGAVSANSRKSKKNNKISQDQTKAWSNRGHHPSRRDAISLDTFLPAFMARLGADMTVRLRECAPSDDDTACVERCCQALQATITQLGSRWRLEIFGSVASGFSTRASDVDATCVRRAPGDGEEEEEEEPVALTILLGRLSPLLKEHLQFKVIEEIASAKVPILRLRFEDHLDIDLSCQNTAALLNTRLLRAYADLDPRVRDLGVAVKIWAKAASVCGAAQSKLSSYTFTLLVIYFMQVHTEVNLPCLDTALFEEDRDPSAAEAALADAKDSLRSCQLSLPELLFRFFYFYTLCFDWGREVASARIGERRSSNDSAFQALRGRFVARIHVEDPYVLQRNLHCVLSDDEEVQLHEAFHMAWQTMLAGGTPIGLRPSRRARKERERLLGGLAGDASPQPSPALGPAAAPDLPPAAGGDGTGAAAPEARKPAAARAEASASESPGPPGTFDSPGPPGCFSSAGSTECGDGDGASAPPEPCASSAGEYRSSDDEGAEARSGVRLRVFSLEAVESEMVQKQLGEAAAPEAQAPRRPMGIADKVKIRLAATTAARPETDDCQEGGAKMAPPAAAEAEGGGKWWRNLGSADVIQAVEAVNPQDDAVSTWRQKRKNRALAADQERCPLEDLRAAATKGISSRVGGSFAANATSIIAARLAKSCIGWE